jgi:hypothetical protein
MTERLRLATLVVALFATTACGESATTAPSETTPGTAGENVGAATVVVSAITSGVYRESDSYVVFIDGVPRGAIGPNGQLVVPLLKLGEHVVSLAGAPPDCRQTKTEQRVLTSSTGSVVGANFFIFCGQTSTIRVVTKTYFLRAPFGDGFTVTLDGGQSEHIDRDGTVLLLEVKVGVHAVTLGGIPKGCGYRSFFEGFRPASSITKGVDVQSGREARADFVVICP